MSCCVIKGKGNTHFYYRNWHILKKLAQFKLHMATSGFGGIGNKKVGSHSGLWKHANQDGIWSMQSVYT